MTYLFWLCGSKTIINESEPFWMQPEPLFEMSPSGTWRHFKWQIWNNRIKFSSLFFRQKRTSVLQVFLLNGVKRLWEGAEGTDGLRLHTSHAAKEMLPWPSGRGAWSIGGYETVSCIRHNAHEIFPDHILGQSYFNIFLLSYKNWSSPPTHNHNVPLSFEVNCSHDTWHKNIMFPLLHFCSTPWYGSDKEPLESIKTFSDT